MRSNGKPTVLMVAYRFPPFVGSSGLHRTLEFCRYLRDYGWQPVVLTVELTTESSRQLYRSRYPHLDDSNWRLLPNG